MSKHNSANRKGAPDAPKKPKTESRNNQGEGDKESARRFNEQQEAFVHSKRGQDAIEHAGDVTPGEEKELAAAEREGRARAREQDPAVTRERPQVERDQDDRDE